MGKTVTGSRDFGFTKSCIKPVLDYTPIKIRQILEHTRNRMNYPFLTTFAHDDSWIRMYFKNVGFQKYQSHYTTVG